MAGESAVFRSLEPEVQQQIIRQMIKGNPLNSAFNDALRTAQTSDFAARNALQIKDSLIESGEDLPINYGESEESVITYPLPEDPPPLAQPLDELSNSGLAPSNANPAFGDEFAAGSEVVDPNVAQSGEKGSGALTAALAAAAGAYAVRDQIKTRQARQPNVVQGAESGADIAKDVEFALDGGQQRGQMDMLGGGTVPNEELAGNRNTFDPRQSDMQLGSPDQLEFDYNKTEMQPMMHEGKVVGYAEMDADGRPRYYDADKKFIGSSLEEIQQNVPMPVNSVEAGKPKIKAKSSAVAAASTTKEIPDEVIEEAVAPKKKTTRAARRKNKVAGYDDIPVRKGKQNVERIPGFETKAGKEGTEKLSTNRRQREKGATRFVDKDAYGTGEVQRVVTNADGTKVNVNKDHPRWNEVEYGGKKVIIDKESKFAYDSKGFQITDTKTLQQLKNTVGKRYKALAAAIKVVF